jgi:hypothetical protein
VVLQQTDPYLITQSTGDIIAFYNAVSTFVVLGFWSLARTGLQLHWAVQASKNRRLYRTVWR